MSEVGLRLEPGARVEELSVGLRQRLEILNALSGGADILLLDEPAGALAPAESAELLSLVQAFTRRGGSAVLITHKLDDALQWADRVTVLRRGTTVFSGPLQSSEGPRLAELMVGEASTLVQGVRSVAGVAGPVRVSCEDLQVAPAGSASTGIRRATLSIRAGEIVGIAAVEGNGQRELLRATAGLVFPSAGRLEVNGRVGFVPEDRTTEGLIPDLTLAENVALALGAAGPWVRGPWLDWRQVRNQTNALIAEFNIRAPDADTRAGALSGGNQQKLTIARALAGQPAVLVIENPTRGLDFRATAEIRRRLQEAAASGIAILFYSSDLDEVLELSSRVVVLARGETVTVPPGADRGDIGALMLGATTASGHRA
jgi:simple sugar transport system ATP-binding protein